MTYPQGRHASAIFSDNTSAFADDRMQRRIPRNVPQTSGATHLSRSCAVSLVEACAHLHRVVSNHDVFLTSSSYFSNTRKKRKSGARMRSGKKRSQFDVSNPV